MKSAIAKREDSGANPDAVSTKTFGRHDSATFWAAKTRRQAWTCGPALLKHPVDACAQLDQPRERHRFIPLGAQHFDHFRKPNPITTSRLQLIQSSLADLYLDRSSGNIINCSRSTRIRNQKSPHTPLKMDLRIRNHGPMASDIVPTAETPGLSICPTGPESIRGPLSRWLLELEECSCFLFRLHFRVNKRGPRL